MNAQTSTQTDVYAISVDGITRESECFNFSPSRVHLETVTRAWAKLRPGHTYEVIKLDRSSNEKESSHA